MQPYPRSPDLVWPGHLHGTGCLSARALETGFPSVVWRVCFGSWFVLGLGFRLRPAIPGSGVGVCVCLCACSACTPPLLAGVCGVGVCAWARVLAAPGHSWLGCRTVCVFVCALRLYPDTPGWGVRCACVCLGLGFGCAPPILAGVLRCVCLCARSACTPPLLAGVCRVGQCAWARVSAAPRNSLLGCWGVLVCVRALPVPRLPWLGCAVFGVCALARVSAAPRHSWLGCWGVRVCVRAPLVPGHPWLGPAVWMCVFRLVFWLRSAAPGWGVLVCVFVCALHLYPATPDCGGGVCVFACPLCSYPAIPGWDVRCGCGCPILGFGCAPPPLAGVLGCACLCARSACTPPLLAGVWAVDVCAWARVSPAPRHSWLVCWGVCVFVSALSSYPAT